MSNMSYFPILVEYLITKDKVIHHHPNDIRNGQPFKVVKTHYLEEDHKNDDSTN